MMRDKLSRREDRSLLKALRAVVLTQYPNPDRTNCPGSAVLHAIAAKRISMFDPSHEHVTACSPCFKELTAIRQAHQRRKILLWAMGTGTAIAILAVWITYFGSRRVENPTQPQSAQTVTPRESSPAESGNAGQTATPVPTTTPPSQDYELSKLDLRSASATRSVRQPESNLADAPLEIRRGLLALAVDLPVGSDAGSYEVEIRDSTQHPVQTAMGQAMIENGITTLRIHINTMSIPPGEYEFAWRRTNFDWRHYPILIR